MSATSGGGGSVSEGSEAGESSQSTMSVSDSPSTSFQAKHADNVTKITLSEEVGHNPEMAGSKINLTLDERQQKDGIINMGFDYEEGGNHGGAVSGGGGGDFKSINGSDKKDIVPEAVNLELVNMVPYSNGNGTSYGVPVNGIPMKKDSEQVDMSTPYDEYFVPVNEHKKYMRGEKLYVTKDKRRPTSWRRCLSWIVACTVITVVLIVAILAGTGVILSQDQNLVKEASVGRNFAGSNLQPSVTQKSSASPTDMTHMYVPRSIESQLLIDNLDFDPALENVNSSAYQQFANMMEDQLKMILFDKETLESGASDIALRVVNISRDPFKVNYRIGWNYKQGVHNPPEPIKMEDVKRRLVESLARNQGYIDKYHIDGEAIKVNHVTDICQMDNGGCSHICYYNHNTQQFTCTCPTHLVLDGSYKNCVEWTGFSEDDAVPVPSHPIYPGMPYESTPNPGNDDDYNKQYEHGLHQGVHHHHLEHQYDAAASPEPTPEPEPKDHLYEGNHKEHEPAPEPTPEPNSDHEYGSHSDLEVKPEPTPEPTTVGNHDSHLNGDDNEKSDDYDHFNKHIVHSEHVPFPEPTPEPTAGDADGKNHEPALEPTAEPTADGKDHEQAPEPTAEPTADGKDHEQASEPTAEPTADGKDHEPAPEPTADGKDHEPAPEPTAGGKDHEPAPEPTAGGKDHEPAPEPTAEPTADGKDHEPAPEPTAEPTANGKDHEPAPEPTADGKDHEPASEPTAGGKDHEPAPEPTADGKDHQPAPEPTADGKDHEPAPEPTADGKDHEPTAEHQDKDHAAEPGPTAEPASSFKDVHLHHEAKEHEHSPEPRAESNFNTKDNEPTAEPAPEPSPDNDSKDFEGHSDSGVQNHFESTVHPLVSSEHHTPDSVASEHGSNNEHFVQSVTYQDGINNSTPRQPESQESGAHSQDNKPTSESAGHHVPYLEDILIKDSSLHPIQEHHPTENSTTADNLNPLENVDVTAKGEPVIEEIIINRSKPSDRPELNPAHTVSPDTHDVTSDHDSNSKPVSLGGSSDHTGPVSKHPQENLPKESSVIMTEHPDLHLHATGQTVKNEKSELVEDLTHPKTTLVNAGSTPTANDRTSTPSVADSERNNEENKNAEQNNDRESNSSGNSLEGANVLGSVTPENNSGQGNLPLATELPNRSSEVIPNTTLHPEAQPESFTIPVSVFSGVLPQQTINITEPVEGEHANPNVRNTGQLSEAPIKNDSTTSANSEIATNKKEATNGHSDSTTANVLSEEGAGHETTPEPQIGVRTSLTGHTGIPKNTDDDSKRTGGEVNSTTGSVSYSVTEGNETTSPEELSNNIKDEGQENEEFNTLLDNEYNNKESHLNDSKEVLLNKYGNKPLKTDKKKLKDYSKGEKIETDKKLAEATVRPAVTTKDFILQKHVTTHDNAFYPEYTLQNEHTTKSDGDGDSIVSGPREVDGVPGVSLSPHGIDNHDISVLQTVAPDFRTETVFPEEAHEFETYKPDSKTKVSETRDGDFKTEKDYQKFDKDYKYDKQKGSKKKDLKKKVGGKDGKNVELEDGRKLFTEVSEKDDSAKDLEVTHEMVPETTMNPSFDGVNVNPALGMTPESSTEESRAQDKANPESITIRAIGQEVNVGQSTVASDIAVSEHTKGPKKEGSANEQGHTGHPDLTSLVLGGVTGKPVMSDENFKVSTVDQRSRLMIDEPSVKDGSDVTPGTVYDGQVPGIANFTGPHMKHSTTFPHGDVDGEDSATASRSGLPGTVFDGVHHTKSEVTGNSDGTTVSLIDPITGIQFSNSSTVFVTGNSTTAHPTIIIRGQSGSLQDGHTVRFANSTFITFGNGTTTPSGVIFNGTVTQSGGHSFTFSNFSTFPNGSAVHPTIVIRGQSGALQDGHEVRFANSSTFHTLVTPPGVFNENQTFGEDGHQIFVENSTVYRIENGSGPGTVFDGHFNPTDGHYHMFTNASGTFVYTNATTEPTFVIRGDSGDFGKAYILGNGTRTGFSGSPQRTHTVIFRNATVFAVGNTTGRGAPTVQIQEVTTRAEETGSNETIQYTHQLTPTSFLSGTKYQVNNYFGYVSKCAAGQFQCVNGTSKRGSACISLSSKCDSINDCSDGSDELGCIENGCPGNFQCSDGTCLKRNLVCNGMVDCSDGGDEKQCENWKCEFDEFQCPSGRCIPIVWQCDGKPDCDNHTDEYHCPNSCGNDEYLCPEGWCIPLTYKCNGIKECSNGEDEQLCDCSHEEFKCQTGGCIPKSQVCNGFEDCPDRSDEWGCVQIEPDTSLLKIRTDSGNFEPVCADNWSSKHSDELCASLGYYSSVPIENGNGSSVTTETSLFFLKSDTTADLNKKFLVNLKRSNETCSSGKLVEVSCQEFSCGSRSMTDSSSVEARFIGGMTAAGGQWPSVALLYNIRNFHSCTANVLTPRWVLASYNCLKLGNKILNEQDWKLFGGSTVFEAEKENAETRRIVSIVPHPQVKFNQFLFSNDLALVELDQPLHFTSNIGAVCLPEQEIQPRQICVTAGWGMNTPEDKSIKQQLQYLPVPTMNLTECNSTEHYSGFITDDKICAGFNTANKSLCYNEEGAPLMCVNDRGEWELQGVLSYHSNCGRGSHPSIFSSITPVRDWIKKTIGNSFERKVIAATKR